MDKKDWKVYYNGNFWGHAGRKRPGTELRVNSTFRWYDEVWHVPSVYICSEGLVVDFCVEIEPERMREFLHKWEEPLREEWKIGRETRRQMERENPMELNFGAEFIINGKTLHMKQGCGVGWIPVECLPERLLADKTETGPKEAREVLDYYGLDKSRAWTIHRCAYPWLTKRKPSVRTMKLCLKQLLTEVPGDTFESPEKGESVGVTNPLTGEQYTLTVLDYLHHNLSEVHFGNPDLEYPCHFTTMEFIVEPELTMEQIRVNDTAEGDRPRRKADGKSTRSDSGAACIGVIGGADGPTAIFLRTDGPKSHSACSAVYFEPKENVKWRASFYEKLREDIIVDLV